MRFSCEGCDSKYMISDDKVGPAGVKVRCKKCGHVTLVRRSEPEGAGAHGGIVDAEWWVAIDEQPVGPVGIAVVQHHWDQGEIGPESLVWYSGLAEWAPIASVPELHGHLGGGMAVAPPAPVPAAESPPPDAPGPAPEEEWRPGAASALAALDEPEQRMAPGPSALSEADVLARDEAQAAPPPPPAESPVAGTDPTGVVPLPMAGLERTGERRVSGTPGPRGPQPRRHSSHAPRKESRSLAAVLLVALVVVGVVAAGLWWMTR
ncbi:MAG: family finger-like protein [Anaeromyxobacteraceae bacterium]|nr:family finger-like protein [Anaeromyxobacteraceae bacterium]